MCKHNLTKNCIWHNKGYCFKDITFGLVKVNDLKQTSLILKHSTHCTCNFN